MLINKTMKKILLNHTNQSSDRVDREKVMTTPKDTTIQQHMQDLKERRSEADCFSSAIKLLENLMINRRVKFELDGHKVESMPCVAEECCVVITGALKN